MSGTRVKRSADYIEGALEFSFIFHRGAQIRSKWANIAERGQPIGCLPRYVSSYNAAIT
jgi:hypothetical protein